MARCHGKDVRAYLGSRDASGDIASVSIKATAATHDATNFASGDHYENDPGLCGAEAEIEAFYDGTAGGIGQQFETLLGAAGSILSIYDGDADAIGDSGILLPDGVLAERGQPISVADLIKLSGSIKCSGKAGLFGKLLHPKGDETVTGVESSLNNSASSANGGRGTLHVTAVTGSWTIKIQHSANDADWVDLISFTQVTAAGGATSETKEVSGTVNQYLRVSSTEDVAGTVTFVCGFARY